MTLWAWFVGTKVGRWLVGTALVIAGLATALFIAFKKGKHAQAKTDEAKNADAAAQSEQEAANAAKRSSDAVRATNDEISKMPDAGTQRVGDAAAGTAADWLHQHADRDQANP